MMQQHQRAINSTAGCVDSGGSDAEDLRVPSSSPFGGSTGSGPGSGGINSAGGARFPGKDFFAAAAFNQFQAGGRAAAFAAAAAAQAGNGRPGGPLGHLGSSNNSTKDGE